MMHKKIRKGPRNFMKFREIQLPRHSLTRQVFILLLHSFEGIGLGRVGVSRCVSAQLACRYRLYDGQRAPWMKLFVKNRVKSA